MYTTLLMIPFFVREVQGKSTELSGLLLGAMSVLVAITAPFGGRLSDAWGRRPSAQVGSVLMLIGAVALLAGLSRTVSAGAISPPAWRCSASASAWASGRPTRRPSSPRRARSRDPPRARVR